MNKNDKMLFIPFSNDVDFYFFFIFEQRNELHLPQLITLNKIILFQFYFLPFRLYILCVNQFKFAYKSFIIHLYIPMGI